MIELHEILGPVRPETVSYAEWESGESAKEVLIRVPTLWVQFECKKHPSEVIEISALFYRNADLTPQNDATEAGEIGVEEHLEEGEGGIEQEFEDGEEMDVEEETEEGVMDMEEGDEMDIEEEFEEGDTDIEDEWEDVDSDVEEESTLQAISAVKSKDTEMDVGEESEEEDIDSEEEPKEPEVEVQEVQEESDKGDIFGTELEPWELPPDDDSEGDLYVESEGESDTEEEL